MKWSPDNQINASFIDIKLLVFFYCGRLSSVQLNHWQALKQQPIIDQHPVEQTAFQWKIKDLVTMDTSKAQVLDKGIRQKSTKRVNSFIACSAFCLGPPNRDPRDSEKRWRVYTSIAMMARHAWRVFKSKTSECMYRRSLIGGMKIICVFTHHPMRTG